MNNRKSALLTAVPNSAVRPLHAFVPAIRIVIDIY